MDEANRKTRIFVVDDEVSFTKLVKLTLEARGNYEVCVLNNPKLAVATALKFMPDIIILDVVMPEIDGGELYHLFKLNPNLKEIPIIFLTAIVRQSELEKNRGMIGGSFYLAKPVSADGLLRAIEQHLRPS
jgi:CheY-like chemotaxis protein